MPKLRHYDHLNTARFVTFSCYRRHQLLTKPVVIEAFLEALQSIRQAYHIRLFGYVIMPEHVHLVLHPPETVTEKINYCHMNPVKRRLVPEPGRWRWSSYNWYAGRQDVPIEIDAIDTVGQNSQYPT